MRNLRNFECPKLPDVSGIPCLGICVAGSQITQLRRQRACNRGKQIGEIRQPSFEDPLGHGPGLSRTRRELMAGHFESYSSG